MLEGKISSSQEGNLVRRVAFLLFGILKYQVPMPVLIQCLFV